MIACLEEIALKTTGSINKKFMRVQMFTKILSMVNILDR